MLGKATAHHEPNHDYHNPDYFPVPDGNVPISVYHPGGVDMNIPYRSQELTRQIVKEAVTAWVKYFDTDKPFEWIFPALELKMICLTCRPIHVKIWMEPEPKPEGEDLGGLVYTESEVLGTINTWTPA